MIIIYILNALGRWVGWLEFASKYGAVGTVPQKGTQNGYINDNNMHMAYYVPFLTTPGLFQCLPLNRPPVVPTAMQLGFQFQHGNLNMYTRVKIDGDYHPTSVWEYCHLISPTVWYYFLGGRFKGDVEDLKVMSSTAFSTQLLMQVDTFDPSSKTKRHWKQSPKKL